MNKIFAVAAASVLLALPNVSHSANKNYKYCSIAGFAQGMNDSFIVGLAMKLINYDDDCATLFKSASKVGSTFDLSKNTGRETADTRLFYEYMDFKKRIEEGILKSAGYK